VKALKIGPPKTSPHGRTESAVNQLTLLQVS